MCCVFLYILFLDQLTHSWMPQKSKRNFPYLPLKSQDCALTALWVFRKNSNCFVWRHVSPIGSSTQIDWLVCTKCVPEVLLTYTADKYWGKAAAASNKQCICCMPRSAIKIRVLNVSPPKETVEFKRMSALLFSWKEFSDFTIGSLNFPLSNRKPEGRWWLTMLRFILFIFFLHLLC